MSGSPGDTATNQAPRQGLGNRLKRALPRPVTFLFGLALGVVATLLVEYLVPLAADDGFEDGELVLMMDWDQSFGRQRHRLIREWNARHPEHQVTVVQLPPSATAARSEMVARFQSGAASGVDVLSLDATWTAEFASAGLIRPLDESRLDLDGFLQGPLETGRYDGRQYALPFNTDAGLLFYRRDLIPQPPSTLEQLESTIRGYFAQPTDPAVEAGFAGQLADYEGFTVNALELMWARGVDVVDADGEVAPYGDMEDGARWMRDALHGGVATGQTNPGAGGEGGRPSPTLILPDSLEFDENLSRQAFQQGRVLFMRNWPVAYRLLTEPSDGEDGAPRMDPAQVGVARLPWPSALGGQNLAIAATTDQPRAAQALIEFLTSERSQQILFEGGFAPTRETVYYDRGTRNGHGAGDVELLQALHAALNDARQRPTTPHYERFSETFRELVRGAVTTNGELPAHTTEALDAALRGEVWP